MIILIIHPYRVLPFEAKGQTPAFVDPDRPMTSKLAFERMQIPTREVHPFRPDGSIQSAQLKAQPVFVPRLNSGLAPGFEERLDPFVLKTLDHAPNV